MEQDVTQESAEKGSDEPTEVEEETTKTDETSTTAPEQEAGDGA